MKYFLSLTLISVVAVSCLKTVKEPAPTHLAAPTETASPSEQASPPEPVASQPASNVRVGKVHRHDGTRFQPTSLTKNPEYYLLYFSASW